MIIPHLPYFHRDALRANFIDHLEQLRTRQPLSNEQLQGLRQLVEPSASAPVPRVDRLDALTTDDQAIALDSTFLISRSDWKEVFTYNHDMGLERFVDRHQARQALLDLFDNPLLALSLLRYASAEQRQALHLHPAVDLQTRLLYGSLFDGLMLTINDRLTEQAAREEAAGLPASEPPSTAVLQSIRTTLANTSIDAASLEVHLQVLMEDYLTVQAQRPTLASITRAMVKQQLFSFLEKGPPLHTITVRPKSSSKPALSLLELVWHPADSTEWQASTATVAELPTPLPLLPPPLIGHCANRVRQSLGQQLQQTLMADEQLTRDYHQQLLALISTLSERLPPADPLPSQPARQAQVLAWYGQATAARLPGKVIKALSRYHNERNLIIDALHGFQDRAQAQAIAARAPDWLRNATYDDQHSYLQVLAKNLLGGSEDYLFDIPQIDAYAREQLQHRLDKDFGAGQYRPETIFVTTNRWITAPPLPGEIPLSLSASYIRHRQTLVEYALDHYHDWDNAITQVNDEHHVPMPPTLRSQYVRTVTKALDLGGHYQRLLRQKFAEHDPGYPRRLATFCRQLPGQMLEAAWRARLKGELDVAALHLITQLLEMPDSSARQQFTGMNIDMTPLLLVADAGLEPDRVPDLYLIGARGAGPLVLYSPYDSQQTYQPFADTRELLKRIRTTPALQTMLLARMPASMRKRYARGGFEEPHLPFSSESDFDLPFTHPGPITLAWRPITGNVLKQLFLDNAQMLEDMAHAQLVTLEEARWKSLKILLGQLWQQVSMFLPGRLGTLVAIFQTETSLLQTLEKFGRTGWSQSLAEFSTALVQALLIGRGNTAVKSVESFWQQLNDDTSLRPYEAISASLQEFEPSVDVPVYSQAQTGAHFVNLKGKVYQVEQLDQAWHLSRHSPGENGPRLQLRSNHTWQIDPQQPRPAEFGGVLSDLSGRHTRRIVSREQIAILAVGMRQIQRVTPHRASLIREAHDTAVTYLVNCHHNISRTTASQLPQQTVSVLRDFFNLAQVSDALLAQVGKPIEKLLAILLSRNYSAADSARYVMGSGIATPTGASAFIYPEDRSKQIFLLDAFFDSPTINRLPLQQHYTHPQAANITRAFTLLHELSHLACQTRDIAYVLGTAPYADWLPAGPDRAWLERAHESGFSAMTPMNKLFKVVDERTGRLRDLRRSDRKGKKLIMKITQAQDLAQARQVFVNDGEKRVQIMLFNADSLALLIYRLGARLHP